MVFKFLEKENVLCGGITDQLIYFNNCILKLRYIVLTQVINVKHHYIVS